MTDLSKGNCNSHENPDLWYPTQPNGGRASTVLTNLALEIKEAVGLCNSCPVKDSCLDEGMKPVNLAYGIWGGLLPGERIAIADEQGIEYIRPNYNKGRILGPRNSGFIEDTNGMTVNERKYAVLFADRIKPYLEVVNG